jgi:hypothetical protein
VELEAIVWQENPHKNNQRFSKPGIVLWNTKFSSNGGAHRTLMNEGVDSKVRRKAFLRPTRIGSRGEIWRLPEKCR